MTISLFLCGDVMTGRGIDQALPFPLNPQIYESYVTDSRVYLELARQKNGQIVTPFYFSYIWGDALREFERFSVDFRMINLETSITKENDYWKGKGINYRMNPLNVFCLTAGGIDCCTLANNHVIDWGFNGLLETINTLDNASIAHCGAGSTLNQASRPAVFNKNGNRVLTFGFGSVSSGVPRQWQALNDRAGINVIDEQERPDLERVKQIIHNEKGPDDIIIVSIHWGENWGFEIDERQVSFAHELIDSKSADIVWGHSSHHVKQFELYHNRLILYGCGDFINDYEGIEGYDDFRADLVMMYFVYLNHDGSLKNLILVPKKIEKLRLNKPASIDIDYLDGIFKRKSSIFPTKLIRDDDTLRLA